MPAIDLSCIYEDGYLDLEDTYAKYTKLFFMELWYVEDGKTIKLPGFGINELSNTDELEYWYENWESYKSQVIKWMEWVQDRLSAITVYDEDFDKDWIKEQWQDDEALQKEYPDFEDYWEEYSKSNSYWESVGEAQRIDFDNFRDELEDEFRILDQEVSEYFDSYDNLNTRSMDNALEEAINEIEDNVSDFLKSANDPDNMDHEERTVMFDGIFK